MASPSLLNFIRRENSINSSILLFPVVIAMAIGSPLIGRLVDKAGPRPVIIAGVALMSLGMLFFKLFSGNLALFIVAGAMVGIALLHLYEATGNTVYRDAAIHIANVLADNAVRNGKYSTACASESKNDTNSKSEQQDYKHFSLLAFSSAN